jgi:uncharacterized membrane protein YtjA (UPF0391 family)
MRLPALSAPASTTVSIISAGEIRMLRWSIIFFIIAIIAAVFGFGGVANDTAHIAKILAVIGIVLAVISFISHRRALP